MKRKRVEYQQGFPAQKQGGKSPEAENAETKNNKTKKRKPGKAESKKRGSEDKGLKKSGTEDERSKKLEIEKEKLRRHEAGKIKSCTALLLKFELGINKGRNAVLFFAALCGTFLFIIVLGLAHAKLVTDEIRLVREQGNTASAYLDGAMEASSAQLRALSYVKRTGEETRLGSICKDDVAYADACASGEETFAYFYKPAFTAVTGRYPEAADEVMLSKKTLAVLGIRHPKAGMKLSFDLQYFAPLHAPVQGVQRFVLSGFFTDHTDSMNHNSIAFFSKRLLQRQRISAYPMRMLIAPASDYLSQDVLIEKLEKSVALPEDKNTKTVPNFGSDGAPAYLAVKQMTGSYLLSLSVLVLLSLGYFLLLYNILLISEKREAGWRAVLRRIGAKTSQIQKAVLCQLLLTCGAGWIVGSAAGAAAFVFVLPGICSRLYLRAAGGLRGVRFFRLSFLVIPFLLLLLLSAISMGGVRLAAARATHRTARKKGEEYTKTESRGPGCKKAKSREQGCKKAEDQNHEHKSSKIRTPISRLLSRNAITVLAGKTVRENRGRFRFICASLALACVLALGTAVLTKGNGSLHRYERLPDYSIQITKQALLDYPYMDTGKDRAGSGKNGADSGEDEANTANTANTGNDANTANTGDDATADNDSGNVRDYTLIDHDTIKEIAGIAGIDAKAIRKEEGIFARIDDAPESEYFKLPDAKIDEIKENAVFAPLDGVSLPIWDGTSAGYYSIGILQKVTSKEAGRLLHFADGEGLHPDRKNFMNGDGVFIAHDGIFAPKQMRQVTKTAGKHIYLYPIGERIVGGRYTERGMLTNCGYVNDAKENFPIKDEPWSGKAVLYFYISANTYARITDLPHQVFRLSFDVKNTQKSSGNQAKMIRRKVQNTGETRIKQNLKTWIKDQNTAFRDTRHESVDLLALTAKSDLIAKQKGTIDMSKAILYGISAAIFLIGIMSYISTIAAELVTKRREFGILKCVGATRRQVLQLMIREGLQYGLVVSVYILLFGNAAILILGIVLGKLDENFVFSYPWPGFLILLLTILLLSAAVPVILHRYYERRKRSKDSSFLSRSRYGGSDGTA